MAQGSEDVVEEAMNILLSVAEKSGNLRNDLKKGILRAVSSLRKEFATLRSATEDKYKLIVDLEMKATAKSNILKALQVGEGSKDRGDHSATSFGG
jgi:hypothetical protein